MYMATTEAIYSETSATITESCSLDSAAKSAACVQTIDAGNYGQDIASTTSFVLTSQYYYTYAVGVTAGVKKLGSGGSCSAKGSSSGAATVGLQGTLTMGAVLLGTLGLLVVL